MFTVLWITIVFTKEPLKSVEDFEGGVLEGGVSLLEVNFATVQRQNFKKLAAACSHYAVRTGPVCAVVSLTFWLLFCVDRFSEEVFYCFGL